MEADWEIELDRDAPVIDACWNGLIDLRSNPEQVTSVLETNALPALLDALLRLNTPSSPVWTSKCDVWEPDQVDPDELDAPPDTANYAMACYIDLLPALPYRWKTPQLVTEWCKNACRSVRAHQLRACRADLVIRASFLSEDTDNAGPNLGITAYISACGPTRAGACEALSSALKTTVDCIVEQPASLAQ